MQYAIKKAVFGKLHITTKVLIQGIYGAFGKVRSIVYKGSSKDKSIYAYGPNNTVSKAYTELSRERLDDVRKKERFHSVQDR